MKSPIRTFQKIFKAENLPFSGVEYRHIMKNHYYIKFTNEETQNRFAAAFRKYGMTVAIFRNSITVTGNATF